MKSTVIIGICIGLAIWSNCSKEKTKDHKFINHAGTSSIPNNGIIKKENTLKIPYETKCIEGKCSTFVFLRNSNRIFAVEYNKEPSCRLVALNLLEILMSCGSPCNYSLFVDLATGRKSNPFFMVLAIDTLKERVAFCDTSNIKIATVFDTMKTPIAINRSFAYSATMSTIVDTAVFRDNGTFVFHYYSGKDFVGIWDSIEIKF